MANIIVMIMIKRRGVPLALLQILITEEEVIGKYTMYENKDHLSHRNYTDNVLENRELLVQFALANELKISNTLFQKPISKLATYRINKSNDSI